MKKINLITEEETLNLEKNINLFSIIIKDNQMFMEYQNINKELYAHAEILTIGSINNGEYIDNVIRKGCTLIGTLANGLNFHHTKVIDIRYDRSELILN